MTQTPRDTSALQAVRARNTLIRAVRTRLKGSGLDIRELAISQPGHPDRSRVYITYANGEVSLRRCTWQYLGYLDGYGSNGPDVEPGLTAEKIIAMLTSPAGSPP